MNQCRPRKHNMGCCSFPTRTDRCHMYVYSPACTTLSHLTEHAGNYVDAGIWSALEPNMAVICACIPSLRPLVSVAGQGFANAPLISRTLRPTSAASSRRIWSSGKSRPSDGAFSQLNEPDYLRPFGPDVGHDVSVRGGRADEDRQDIEALEMPQQGIKVQTEVILSTSDRLHYDDRLF